LVEWYVARLPAGVVPRDDAAAQPYGVEAPDVSRIGFVIHVLAHANRLLAHGSADRRAVDDLLHGARLAVERLGLGTRGARPGLQRRHGLEDGRGCHAAQDARRVCERVNLVGGVHQVIDAVVQLVQLPSELDDGAVGQRLALLASGLASDLAGLLAGLLASGL